MSQSSADHADCLHFTDARARPDDGGKKGTPIQVYVNMFRVKVGKKTRKDDLVAYHYDVALKKAKTDTVGVKKGKWDTGAVAAEKERAFPIAFCQRIFQTGLSAASKEGQHGLTEELFAGIAYDGRKHAYSMTRLPSDSFSIEITLGDVKDDKNLFSITIRLVAQVDLAVLELFCQADRQIIANNQENVHTAMQALDILLRHEPAKTHKIHGAGGKRFYDGNNTQRVVQISQGAEIWKGFMQSARPTCNGMVINLDVAFSAFMTGGKMTEVASHVLGKAGGGGFGGGRGGRGGYGGGRGGYGGGGGASPELHSLEPHEQQALRKKFRMATIRATHRPHARPAPFKGFSDRPVSQITFEKDGQRIRLVDYYQDTYNINLRYPNLPAVDVGGGRKYVPMELCEVQRGTALPPLSLSGSQVQDMIRESALRPSLRLSRVKEIRSDLAYEKSAILKDWDVEVATEMVTTTARVLRAPTVIYNGRSIPASNGAWNMANAQVIKSGMPLESWALVNFTRAPPEQCYRFAETLIHGLLAMGLNVVNRRPQLHMVNRRVRPEDVLDELKAAGKLAMAQSGNKPPQLFVIFFDGQESPVYEAVKRTCSMDLPVPVASQVLQIKKAFSDRGAQQYCANVGMKINIKLGGLNSLVEENDLPRVNADLMMIGIGVTHGGPGSGLPSIAGSVASIDPLSGKFSNQIRLQHNPDQGVSQEIILDLFGVMKDHLDGWMKYHDGKLPTSILLFRDGISEGQYSAAQTNEIMAIKKACSAIQSNYAPKLTYIVCTKRHNTRFFAVNDRDNEGRSGNLPAGTVVDKDVVHPFAFEFYLQSQAGLVGTARPSKNVVLMDENGFSSDDMQQLAYSLTYGYSRATRSVSTAPLAYYSDVLCAKARLLLYGSVDSSGASTVSGGSGAKMVPLSSFPDVMRQLNRIMSYSEAQWYM